MESGEPRGVMSQGESRGVKGSYGESLGVNGSQRCHLVTSDIGDID